MIVGGDSLGCPLNAGAAGTRFDVTSQSLIVSNKMKQSRTDTVLLAFPVRPLWGSMVVEESARIGVPLHWSTIRVKSRPFMSTNLTQIMTLDEHKFNVNDNTRCK